MISIIAFKNGLGTETASVFHTLLSEVLFINLNGFYAKNRQWWERNFVVIAVHETLHVILSSLGEKEACGMLDNLWKSTEKSRFFIDGNWKWFR